MKITLASILTAFASALSLNNRFDDIEEHFNDKVLYRDNPSGEPNQMLNDLDMNSNKITNLPSPISDQEPARWIDVKNGVTGITETVPSAVGNEDKALSSNGIGLAYKKNTFRHDTVASMLGDTSAVLGQVWECEEYASGSNSGLLTFKVVAAATGTADGGSYLDHDTLSLQYERIFNTVISVKDFGALGDGVTDDAPAIRLALAAHGSIYAPPGNYKLGSTVYVMGRGKVFQGAGVEDTIFTLAAGVEGVVVGNDATSSETNHNMSVGGFKIVGGAYGLTLGGNGTGPKAMLGEIKDILITGATTGGLRLISPQGTALHNVVCEANAVGLIGEDLQAITNTQFFNCRFFNSTSHGCQLKHAWGVRFYGCGFEANGGWGCSLEKNTQVLTNLMFIGNWFEANSLGSVVADDITITDLSFIKNECNGTSGTYHFDLLADNLHIIANRFLLPTTNAFRIQNAGANYNVSGNTGTISSIPTSRNGFHNSQDGDVDCSTLSATSATLNDTLGTDALTVATGDLRVTDGVARITNNSTTTDGHILGSYNATGSVGALTRINCGADVDRVGLKFTVNGVVSTFMWIDDTGQPRWKTSLPTTATDGTAM
ncbi:MAG: hypothetical protein JKY81_02515 [Colwellia sp.]|nr:hypothetical protein [Colwellia sp.]